MHSKKIDLKTMRNTRDLGGIVNKNGLKIKKNRLYRSGELSRISAEDAILYMRTTILGQLLILEMNWK